jgi:ketosteroid isomerase-like protein
MEDTMKRPHELMAFLTGFSLLVSGCTAPPQEPAVDLAAERSAIEGLIRDQLAANNQPGAAGADGYVSVASEDVILLPPNAERVEGRQAVRDFVLQFTSSADFSITYSAEQVEVASSGDLAYAIGSYEFSLTDAEGNAVTDRGKFMDALRKAADGTWKVTVITFSSDLPVQVGGSAG